MPHHAIEAAVYSFEGLLPDLEAPPIAARRALDHAGVRLSIEAWRSLSLDDRERVALAGVAERVDVEIVLGLVRRTNPPPQRVGAVFDPDPAQPPEALAHAVEHTRPIDPRRWSRLRGLDRYALAHTYRRAVARSAFSVLGEAYDAILPPAPPTGPAPPQNARAQQPVTGGYQPAGFYSTVGGTPPDAREAAPQSNRGGAPLRSDPARGSWIPPRMPSEDGAPYGEPRRGRDRYAEATQGGRPAARPPSIAPPPPAVPAFSTHAGPGGEVHMVDVARKPQTERRAVASGCVRMRPETAARIGRRDVPKGEVLATARIAGIMAAKRTPELIPLCHQVALSRVDLDIEVDVASARVNVVATAEAFDRTGVEMEAMVATSVACLTIYDMLKGIDRDMVVSEVKLLEKSGGQRGNYRRDER